MVSKHYLDHLVVGSDEFNGCAQSFGKTLLGVPKAMKSGLNKSHPGFAKTRKRSRGSLVISP